MKDIVEELRTAAHARALANVGEPVPYDPALGALLYNAAAEIERLRGGLNVPQQIAVSYSELVKDLKHHLRGEIDG
jgi:hypothetical protein